MDEATYHRISEEFINAAADLLEPYDEDGAIEIEYQEGILTLNLPSSKQLLLSKHTTSRQLWLSSPQSGGLHFAYKDNEWMLTDGRTLASVLSHELETLAGISVKF